MRYFYLLVFLFFLDTFAQDIEIYHETTSEIEVCGSSVNYKVKILNNTGFSWSAPKFKIDLPTGILYSEDSWNEISSTGLSPIDLTSSDNLLFETSSVANADSIYFEFELYVLQNAIAFQNAGGIFRNEVTVYASDTVTSLSPSYNILYPALNIITVNPTNQIVLTGDTTSREITIVNAGFGKIDGFYITDVFTEGAELIASDFGEVIGDSIILAGADFTAIGNGDYYFDHNESITITEQIITNACGGVTSTSTIRAGWGCEIEKIETVNSYANITIDYYTPNIALVANPSISPCFANGEISEQQLMIVNKGSGKATNVYLNLFKSSGDGYDQTLFTKFLEESVQIKINSGVWSSLSPSSTEATMSSGEYSCLGGAPIGKMGLNLPLLNPNDTIYVQWEMVSCGINSCGNQIIQGWEADIAYTDFCELNTYSKNIVGQGINQQFWSFFSETPAEINAGETIPYSFIVSSFKNTLPQTEFSQYEFIFELDVGLIYESLEYRSNATIWSAETIEYDAILNTVTARFNLPEPFTIPKSEFILNVTGECGTEGWKTINYSVNYIPDYTCSSIIPVPMSCDNSTSSYLKCPGGLCEGLNYYSLEVARTSLGIPDNNLDGIPDESGALNFERVKLNRAMVSDTVAVIQKGFVYSGTGDSWNFGRATVENDEGVNLEIVGKEVVFYRAAYDDFITISNPYHIENTIGSAKSFTIILNLASYVDEEPLLAGYNFSDGDSIFVTFKFEVISNVSGNIKETLWSSDFYLSDVYAPSPAEEFGCDFHFAKSTLIGYEWRNNYASNYTLRACDKTIIQHFGLSIGDCCSNYAGGNLFPYEYRNWGNITEAFTVIPPNYSFESARFRQSRTINTNGVSNQTINDLIPDNISGDTIYFNLQQYYDSEEITLSDDGFDGWIQITLAPNCFVPQNTYQPIKWFFKYQKDEKLGGGQTAYLDGPNDQIRYIPSDLDLIVANPWTDAITKEVTWNVQVKNTGSSSASFTWFHLDSIPNLIISDVTDDAGGTSFEKVEDIYLLGSIPAGSSKNITIHGEIINCDTVFFKAYTGYECTGYPANFESFSCNISSTNLYVEPKPSAFQVRLFATPLSGDICSQFIEVGLEVSSVKIAHMFNMEIEIFVGDTNKVVVLCDSSEFKYNLDNPYTTISDPLLSGNTYNYPISGLNPDFALQGIPGVLDLTNNRYQLKTTIALQPEFLQGDFIQFRISGENACTQALPTILLDYDPNTKFTKDNTVGLHLEASDNWSASWGDYNGDGFDDLFIPNKNPDQPSSLYLNNGDGTMTKVNSGIITEELGESVSGTWGDYDNDGDLDLFVANNSYAKNRLYQNQGDGTFVSIQDDPIVDLGTYSHSAAWGDYDKDGYLDLVVTDIHPTHFNRLFHNNGDGSFSLVGSSPVSMMASSAVGVSWIDYDVDGDLDIFIANTNGENNALFINENGNFNLDSTNIICTDGGYSVGGVWGDCDNDGDPDLYVTNARYWEPNFFYENLGDGSFNKVVVGDFVTQLGNSHGATWVDYDNDGDLDLMVANDQYSYNFLYSNNGDKTFTQVTNAITQEASNSYGISWADFDRDGDNDLLVANHGTTTNDFFKNEKGACNNFVGIELEGCNSNFSGIGAKVKVKANINGVELWQIRELSSQTGGLGGQNSLKMVFGLGNASIVDSILIIWPSGIRQILTNEAVNQYYTINEDCGSKICGEVYFDENLNGIKDASEHLLANQEIIIQPGNIHVYSNETGYFQTYVQDGTYTVEFVANDLWVLNAPLTPYEVVVAASSSAEYCENNFGLTSICESPDLEVRIGATAFRRGLTNDITIAISNSGVGDVLYDYNLTLTFSDNTYLVGQGIPVPTEMGSERSYTFTLPAINRLSDTLIYLKDSVDAYAVLDELVTFSAQITTDEMECGTVNNLRTLEDVVVGSIDPNDKQVFVAQKGISEYVNKGEDLIYKIRFQNVGNYAARRVFIVDTLSNDLDPATVEFLDASHNFSFANNNGILTWINNSIELPDSASNLEGSNGYVKFKVKVKESTHNFTPIANTGYIQFDYNDFIQTNAVISHYQSDDSDFGNVFIYPNPTENFTQLKFIENGKPILIEKCLITDVNGKVVEVIVCSESKLMINTENYSPGIYLIQLTSASGTTSTGKLIVH